MANTIYHYFSTAWPRPSDSHCLGSVTKRQRLLTPTAVWPKKKPVGHPRKKRDVPVTIDLTSSPEKSEGADHSKPSTSSEDSRDVDLPTQESSPSSPIQRRLRQMFSHGQKQKVALYARHHGTHAASRCFGVHHKTMGRWMKEQVETLKNPNRRKHRKGQGRKISYPTEIDEQILQWILEKRDQSNLPVSTKMIPTKALALIKQANPAFKASVGRLRKFLRRHNLVLRACTSIAQLLPADLEHKIAQFHAKVQHVRENSDFPYRLIANIDETPIYFDMVPGKTEDRKGKKSITFRTTKSEKRHVTSVLCCTALGNFLPAMIIFN